VIQSDLQHTFRKERKIRFVKFRSLIIFPKSTRTFCPVLQLFCLMSVSLYWLLRDPTLLLRVLAVLGLYATSSQFIIIIITWSIQHSDEDTVQNEMSRRPLTVDGVGNVDQW